MTEQELLSFLQENKNTEFGIQHHFSDIKSVADYRREVPLSEYKDYEASIQRMYEGEENVLTAYDAEYFLSTSGSSGNPKMIPLTKEALSHYDQIYTNMMRYGKGKEGRHLMLSVFRTEIGKDDRCLLLSAALFRDMYAKGICDTEDYVGGKRLFFAKDIKDIMYAKLWCAFFEENLLSIQSIFLYDVLLFFEYMRKNASEMLQCMRKKEIPKEVRLPNEVKELLLTKLCPSEKRIEAIQKEIERGFGDIAFRLWNNLCFISGIGGFFFQARERLLRKFTGTVPFHYFAYASSECEIGYADGLENSNYTMISENGFFELLDMETGETLSIWEAEPEHYYELVVTNKSGLYRYLQKDIVKVVEVRNEIPVLSVYARRDQLIDIAGEKTDGAMLEQTAAELCMNFGIYLFDYAVGEDVECCPMRYVFYMEPEPVPAAGTEQLAKVFDEILARVNPDYEDLRNLSYIGEPRAVCLEKGELAARRSKGSSQNKPSHRI